MSLQITPARVLNQKAKVCYPLSPPPGLALPFLGSAIAFLQVHQIAQAMRLQKRVLCVSKTKSQKSISFFYK